MNLFLLRVCEQVLFPFFVFSGEATLCNRISRS
jgi:hypothetical protein